MEISEDKVKLKFIQQLLPNFSSAVSEECQRLKIQLDEVDDRSAIRVLQMSTNLSIKLMSDTDTGNESTSGYYETSKDVAAERTFCSDEVAGSYRCRSEGGTNTNELQKHLDDLDIVKEYVWEQFNVGHWKQVALVWRSLYSFVSLLKVVLQMAASLPVCDIIKECDLGLLMGAPILDDILSKVAFRLHVHTQDHNEGQVPSGILVPPTEIIYQSSNPQCNSSQSQSQIQHKMVMKFQSLLPNQCKEARSDITIISKPSMENFIQDYFSLQNPIPVVLTHIIDHWPARSKWNLEYLRQVAGSRTVPIELGSKYTSEDWTQKLVTLEHFIDVYIKDSEFPKSPSENTPKGYLAQHQLFQQIPELMQDIRIPEYCYVGCNPNIEINAWLGPSGTISPVHYDPKHNLLAQVFGSKIIRVFPPSEWDLLYPHQSGSMLFNTSQIDVEDPQLFLNFPRCQQAKYMDILLEPGMVLYMPPKWAHYVKSLSPSFSVSFWFE